MKTQAFGIFEGGGAKGLAHAGALKAAENKFEYIGVAGTSAGAIIAALIACRYEADEIYSKGNPSGLFSADLTKLLDPGEWQSISKVRREFLKSGGIRTTKIARRRKLAVWLICCICIAVFVTSLLLGGLALYSLGSLAVFLLLLLLCSQKSRSTTADLSLLFMQWIQFHIRALRYWKLIRTVTKNHGILTTQIFHTWLNDVLGEKLRQHDPAFQPSGNDGCVTFADLPIPLKIIACDFKNRKMRVFQSPQDDQISVADAVCASMSIPVAFVPKEIENELYVDGGIMSNFPAWVFDTERKTAPRLTPTIGFRLIDGRVSSAGTEDRRFLQHMSDVSYSAFFGDNTLETRNVSTLHELKLRVKLDLLDFDANKDEKDAVYDAAYRDAKDCLSEKVHRPPDARMAQILKIVEQAVRRELNHEGHLRISILLPTDINHLQVVYSINMNNEFDCDDRLVLGKHQGCCGKCWESVDIIVCDLEDAKTTFASKWNMDKYQQRLVRETLKSLCSVPILSQKEPLDTLEGKRGAFLGVMSLDSDDDMVDKFRETASQPQNILVECAAVLATRLQDGVWA